MDITELEELIDSDITAGSNEEPTVIYALIPYPSTTQSDLLVSQLSQGYLKIHSIEPYERDYKVIVTDDTGNLTAYIVAYSLLLRIKEATEQYAASQGAGVSPNSASLEFDETTSRFNGAIWYDKITTQHIILAGLGGIGSWTALLLGRMKPALLALYDHDVVERSNMSGQLYGASEIGYSKAASIRKIVSWLSDYFPSALDMRYSGASPVRDVMICGFVLGPVYGALIGFITPLTRSLIFGMPPILPTGLGGTSITKTLFPASLKSSYIIGLIPKSL